MQHAMKNSKKYISRELKKQIGQYNFNSLTLERDIIGSVESFFSTSNYNKLVLTCFIIV